MSKVLLVDDSILVRSVLNKLISSWPGYHIAGEAGNGKKGVELALQLNPDLILMDVNMPVMDGIEATGEIMKRKPVPIIIFTSEDVGDLSYRAINMGALEVIPKPGIHKMNDPVFEKEFRTLLDHAVKYGSFNLKRPEAENRTFNLPKGSSGKRYNAVVIGASTGGPSTVRTVLKALPENFPLPVLLTQHIEIGFDDGYVRWLNEECKIDVVLASSGDQILPGKVYVAPATHHLVCLRGKILLDDGPKILNQKPSVDSMFLSAAKEYGGNLIAVLLTGMGRDGAEGCLGILKKGGITLVQDKETSMIFGMPKAAIELGGASEILSLDNIIKRIMELAAR